MNFCMYTTLGQGQEMTLTFNTHIPSGEMGLPVPEKIFEGFLPHMGMAAILVMWPASCHQIFRSLKLKAFIKNWFRSAK